MEEIKQNYIRKGVLEKVLSGAENLTEGEEKKRRSVPKQGLNPRMLICSSLPELRGS